MDISFFPSCWKIADEWDACGRRVWRAYPTHVVGFAILLSLELSLPGKSRHTVDDEEAIALPGLRYVSWKRIWRQEGIAQSSESTAFQTAMAL